MSATGKVDWWKASQTGGGSLQPHDSAHCCLGASGDQGLPRWDSRSICRRAAWFFAIRCVINSSVPKPNRTTDKGGKLSQLAQVIGGSSLDLARCYVIKLIQADIGYDHYACSCRERHRTSRRAQMRKAATEAVQTPHCRYFGNTRRKSVEYAQPATVVHVT